MRQVKKMKLFDYDDSKIESVYEYAKKLEGMTFNEILNEYKRSPVKNYEEYQTSIKSKADYEAIKETPGDYFINEDHVLNENAKGVFAFNIPGMHSSEVASILDEKYGIYEYLIEQKKNGRIRHLGFSAHGSYDVIKRFLDAYGKDMEFCQLQLNYLDWSFQDAKAKVELLKEHDIPVWVMEPLRGGKLASLSEENTKKLREMRPDEETPAWAFRFLQSLPEVKVVLSGMSNMEQLQANIRTYEEDKPLSGEEMKNLLDIADSMLKKKTLPCTACHYCVSHCPQELDIPELLNLYNEHCFTEGGFIAPMALSSYPDDKKPSACIGCRSCEAVCPQQIKISEAMSDFAEKMGM